MVETDIAVNFHTLPCLKINNRVNLLKTPMQLQTSTLSTEEIFVANKLANYLNGTVVY